MRKQPYKNKSTKKPLIITLIILLLIGFALWCRSLFYPADETALQALATTKAVTFVEASDYYGFIPSKPISSSAFILYPGALVDANAYAPLMADLAEEGITSFITKMPFDMAILKGDAANTILEDYPDIEDWYIGGHSLGGVMAADYVDKNPESIKGIVFLAAYANKDLSDQNLKVLSLYGTNDKVLNMSAYTDAQSLLPANHLKEIILKGGNHANFGNYGIQKGDGVAEISNMQQQQLTVQAILEMIQS